MSNNEQSPLVVGCGKRTLGHGDSDTCGEPWMGGPDIYLCEACKVRQQWAESIGQITDRLVPDTRNQLLRDGSGFLGVCQQNGERYALTISAVETGSGVAMTEAPKSTEPSLPDGAPMVVLPHPTHFPDYEGGYNWVGYDDALRTALRKVGVGVAEADSGTNS